MKHFKTSEFDSPDQPGSGSKMDPEFLLTLDAIREDCSFPFVITSGYRTAIHNQKVGGKPNSAHKTGKAVDISATSGFEKFCIVQYAIKHGVMRIGIGKDFVHLDNALDKLPWPCIWTY